MTSTAHLADSFDPRRDEHAATRREIEAKTGRLFDTDGAVRDALDRSREDANRRTAATLRWLLGK